MVQHTRSLPTHACTRISAMTIQPTPGMHSKNHS